MAKKKKNVLEEEIEDIEQWMIERKNFLIKLGWVAGIIIVLLIFSQVYMKVKGFG